jgi:hypothetical protein
MTESQDRTKETEETEEQPTKPGEPDTETKAGFPKDAPAHKDQSKQNE